MPAGQSARRLHRWVREDDPDERSGPRPGVYPDAARQAPLEIGDRVTYAGILVNDAAGTYVSGYAIESATAIYTWPGTSPAYVSIEAGLVGTGSLTVIGAREGAVRTWFEGMTSDPSRGIHLYGIDVNPATGEAFDRDWGSIGVDEGQPTGAEKGRWRYREPCLPFGSVATVNDGQCIYGPDGIFLPPTCARCEPSWRVSRPAGQGRRGPQRGDRPGVRPGVRPSPLPDPEYVFPDAAPDGPMAPNPFDSLPFLACGGLTSSGGTVVGRLDPWPGVTPPTCPGSPTAHVLPDPGREHRRAVHGRLRRHRDPRGERHRHPNPGRRLGDSAEWDDRGCHRRDHHLHGPIRGRDHDRERLAHGDQ